MDTTQFIIGQIIVAATIWGAIRADIRNMGKRIDEIKENTDEAHKRIDRHLEQTTQVHK